MNDNKVLAVVNGNEITERDLNFLLEGLGQQKAQFNSPEGREKLLQELITQEMLYLDAIEKGMDKDEVFVAEVEDMKKNILKQHAMRNLLSNIKVDDEEISKFYAEHKDMFKKPESARASHILVDEEEQAKDILKEINEGLSFEEAAKKYSKCPSNANGGDLGEFTRGRMVPEFENAVFEMNTGDISEPVKTQFGYHIIKATDRKPEGEMTLEEVRPQLNQQLIAMKQNKVYVDKSNELKAKYDVKINK